MHFRYEHEFDIDPPAYWELFLSEEFSIELYKHLGMKNRQVVERTDDGKTIKRVQRMTPEVMLPGFIRSLVSDPSYTEHDLFRRDRSDMDVVIEPALMKNKLQMKGLYSVTPMGDRRCRRTFEGDVKVSIPLVGGQVEKYMVDELRTSYDKAAHLTREWIARRQPRS